MPAEELVAYCFRAANLGPFFQFESISSTLSTVPADVLGRITLSSNQRPKAWPEQPLDRGNNHEVETVLYAAEMRSTERVKEAFDRNPLYLSEALPGDAYPSDLAFIQKVMKTPQAETNKTDQAADLAR